MKQRYPQGENVECFAAVLILVIQLLISFLLWRFGWLVPSMK